jgi:hypothetical protein
LNSEIFSNGKKKKHLDFDNYSPFFVFSRAASPYTHTHTHTHNTHTHIRSFRGIPTLTKRASMGDPRPNKISLLTFPRKRNSTSNRLSVKRSSVLICIASFRCSYSVHTRILTHILKFRRKYVGMYAHMYRFFQVYIQCSYTKIY